MDRRIGFFLTLAVAAVLVVGCTTATPAPPDPATKILLVRHAETEGAPPNPALSPAGRARAERLAELLASEGIERILTTDYERTRSTAAPLARTLGVDAEVYDPRALSALAEALRASGGKVLVVGHSNTTPALVGLLGGDPGEPLSETEYDRLYRVDLATGATTLQRYE